MPKKIDLFCWTSAENCQWDKVLIKWWLKHNQYAWFFQASVVQLNIDYNGFRGWLLLHSGPYWPEDDLRNNTVVFMPGH